jgi:type I restriction enzyme S subunit
MTEQLPEDGTAEELYQQIQAEKQALIQAGKLKKRKPQPEITDNDIPFAIPSNWKWVPLGELISIESGRGLTAAQMKPGRIPVYGGNGISGHHDCAFVPEGTVVIGRVGYYCGSVHVTEQEAWVTDNAFITTYPEKCIDKWFLVHALRHMKLGQENNGAAQPVVSGKKIYPLAFPLPPLAEQKRIAAKLEELLQLCERPK